MTDEELQKLAESLADLAEKNGVSHRDLQAATRLAVNILMKRRGIPKVQRRDL